MNEPPSSTDPSLAERLAAIERRLGYLEAYLGLTEEELPEPGTGKPATRPTATSIAAAPSAPAAADLAPAAASTEADEELELVVGQSWFARVGIIVLTLGGAFALSLPYRNLPPVLPSVVGYGLVAVLLFVARVAGGSLELVASYLRGAGMALLYFATLRLFYFGSTPVLETSSPLGRALLVLVVGVNVVLAWRRDSAALMALSLATGFATAIAVGSPWFVFGIILALCALVVAMRLRREWQGLLLFGTAAAYFTHALWALNNPLLGRPLQLVNGPVASVGFLLAYAAVLASGTLLRRDRSQETPLVVGAAVLNCGLGYGLFLVHTLASFRDSLLPSHLAASAVFLAVAVAFWLREHSRGSTFFYAMTGYAALSVALLRAVEPPNVFVWLSLQSLIVVGTALWFRSRFIVVANFFIYLAVVVGYVVTREQETGISLGFGLVALVTARALNWQQRRLELKTEMMRNAYLASAFLVFPYALYYLVPRTYVGVAWVGIAVAYYVLNFIVRSPKYRWMGHLTLLLTVGYLLVIGTTQLEPAFRILSFLVLGTVLLAVSLVFTRLKQRRDREKPRTPPAEVGHE